MCFIFFFFNDTATTEIYTLSLHDALPISNVCLCLTFALADLYHLGCIALLCQLLWVFQDDKRGTYLQRSEEHTSELQSRLHLVCRLLLEKKKRPASRTQII